MPDRVLCQSPFFFQYLEDPEGTLLHVSHSDLQSQIQHNILKICGETKANKRLCTRHTGQVLLQVKNIYCICITTPRIYFVHLGPLALIVSKVL